MSNFSTDADLLAHEPNVFVELPFASQQKLHITDAAISGTAVTSTTGGFNSLAVNDVAVIAASSTSEAVSVAIALVSDDNTLELDSAPVLDLSSDLTLSVRTLLPQATLVHNELMRAVRIDPDDSNESLDESSVMSVELMKQLESLGTLARAYAAAVSLVGDNKAVQAKAMAYQQRFISSLHGACVLIDTDGDGQADVWRTPGVGRLTRA